MGPHTAEGEGGDGEADEMAKVGKTQSRLSLGPPALHYIRNAGQRTITTARLPPGGVQGWRACAHTNQPRLPCDSLSAGRKVAAALIESKLAACVNMIPGVESMYWWEGKVETDSELLLMIKSRASLVNALTAKVKAVHPYDTPEVIAVPITGGSDAYIQWLLDSTVPAPPST